MMMSGGYPSVQDIVGSPPSSSFSPPLSYPRQDQQLTGLIRRERLLAILEEALAIVEELDHHLIGPGLPSNHQHQQQQHRQDSSTMAPQ